MATFMFYCAADGQRQPIEAPVGESPAAPWCVTHHRPLVRDYRGEAVGVPTVNNLTGHADGREASWRDFLPSTDDYKGPGDPDGTIGLRKWRDEHQPANPRARHPEEHALRRSF